MTAHVDKVGFPPGWDPGRLPDYSSGSNIYMLSDKTNWTSITRHLYIHAPIHPFLWPICLSVCLKKDIGGKETGKDLRRAGDGE